MFEIRISIDGKASAIKAETIIVNANYKVSQQTKKQNKGK
jgi:hypothetical protein